jgi:hypothetical protein
MAIVIACECGRKLQIKDEFAGQEGQCPACSRTFLIPGSPAVEEVPYLPTGPTELADPGPLPAVAAAREVSVDDKVGASEPINNHGGEGLHPHSDFFAGAPPDIGPVVTAYTTLRQGVEPWTPGSRLGLTACVSVAAAAVAFFIVNLIEPDSEFWYFFWPLLAAAVGAAIALASTRFKHTCTYVGRDGVARFTCTGNRVNISEAEVFRFRDASELRTSQTRHYHNGAYTGTSYTHTWSDVGGRKRYAITGRHKSEKGNPPSTDPFQFARAAEVQWTIYLLDETYRTIELNGTVLFNLTGGQWVRLGKGYMILSTGGDGAQWNADEIAMVNVAQGVVRIKRADAQEGWFSSQGVFKFSFDSLANAQLFLHLCEKLVGVAVG